MARKRRGYKVVWENECCDTKWSATAPWPGSICFLPSLSHIWRRLEYCVGKPTRPPKGAGPLCVFRTNKAAQRFADSCWAAAWRCTYVLHPMPEGLAELLPRGTVLADEVTLLPGGRID